MADEADAGGGRIEGRWPRAHWEGWGVVQAEQLRGELVGPLFHCQVVRIARGGLRFELDDRRGRRPATRGSGQV